MIKYYKKLEEGQLRKKESLEEKKGVTGNIKTQLQNQRGHVSLALEA